MTKRELTEREIKNILSFIKPRRGIPRDTGIKIMHDLKKQLEDQIRGELIYPHLIPRLRDQIEHSYNTSLIQPGESVGIICAQSIGEKQTQTTLNTFHTAGLSDKTMTVGVPRFQELLNATKDPKMVNCKIYFKKHNRSIQEIRNHVCNKLVGLTLNSLTSSSSVQLDKKAREMVSIV